MLWRISLIPLFGLLACGTSVAAEQVEILPKNAKYDTAIPTPASYFGFRIGQRHLHHHQLVAYLEQLAEISDRVTIQEYARSYGGRPLVMLLITSPQNHDRLETIRQRHLQLADPDASTGVDIKSLPAVINMGYGVHGNEPSASNVAPLVAYHLAAGTGKAHQRLLHEVVVLLDPCLNPDGFERFANWANNHRGAVPNPDANHREHREGWPSGRTNYYWFDINRDWLPVQHPESQGRLAMYHRWKPNVLLDFHEMGSNATYFFQPGVPKRNHPRTPHRTFELTRAFAKYHAAALDRIGSLYFTEERYDDYYMGKGSAYPDLHGAVGILFEQASARGQVQETANGRLSFPFTIRNQFLTSMSSLQATRRLRKQLLKHKRTFYRDAQGLVRSGETKGFVVAAPGDAARLHRFLEVLDRHQIRAYRCATDLKVDNKTFLAGESYMIPAAQPEFRFLQTLFETRTRFAENIFYDVSTWTLPLAFNLKYATLKQPLGKEHRGEPFSADSFPKQTVETGGKDLAYVIDWRGYYAPKTLYRLLAADVKVKVATQPFRLQLGDELKSFACGTLLVPLGIQLEKRRRVVEIIKQAAAEGVVVYAAKTGLTPHGIDFGSSSFVRIHKPKVLLVTGKGVSTYGAGEVWHLLDRRFAMPVTMVDAPRLGSVRLSDYSVVIMVSGTYSSVTDRGVERLKRFLSSGGTLVAIGAAISWVDSQKIAAVKFRRPDEQQKDAITSRRPYNEASRDAALGLVKGSIFRTHVDHTHPIGYGLGHDSTLPVFRTNTVFLEISDNSYSTPVAYDAEPLLSGYISDENLATLSGSASVVVHSSGQGRVILMADNPNFRAFWYGTNRLFLNCLFFGPMIRVT